MKWNDGYTPMLSKAPNMALFNSGKLCNVRHR